MLLLKWPYLWKNLRNLVTLGSTFISFNFIFIETFSFSIQVESSASSQTCRCISLMTSRSGIYLTPRFLGTGTLTRVRGPLERLRHIGVYHGWWLAAFLSPCLSMMVFPISRSMLTNLGNCSQSSMDSSCFRRKLVVDLFLQYYAFSNTKAGLFS